MRVPAAAGALLVGLTLPANAATAPERKTVVAGAHYEAGPLHSLVFGPHYRHLWTTPIEVEVLDLDAFAGGLTPKEKGGRRQTKVLELEGADGREYRVRSVDKDPSATLPPELRNTFAEWVVRDQTSAGHPAGALIADAFADAAGVLHVERRLVVLPDHPRLGKFRAEFAEVLGILEPNPDDDDPLPPGFEGVTKIIDSEELLKLLDSDPRERIDAPALLRARLLDLFLGDWDRHFEQWEWVQREGHPHWLAVPKDRDQVFSKFDGLALAIARGSQPRLVNFTPEYPDMLGITWNSRFLDRRLLAELDETAFVQSARELQGVLTDAVIEDAVRRQPEPYYRLVGAWMTRALKARRDLLENAARAFYAHLARDAEVYGTDAAEALEIVRNDDGAVEIRLAAQDASEPYFRRVFRPGDTSEVRVFLRAGHDRAASHGLGTESIKVRVVGGPGSDVLDDSAGGRTRFYDVEGENRVVEGPGTEVHDRPYDPPRDRIGDPARDWGRETGIVPWVFAGADVGVFLGGEWRTTRYGFRRHPYESRQAVRAGYATGLSAVRAEYEGLFYRTNSRTYVTIFGRGSGAELIRFHGFGNETPAEEPSDFYRVEQPQLVLAAALTRPAGDWRFWAGPLVKFSHTRLEPGQFITIVRPYGVGDFGQAGFTGGFQLDRRDHPRAATSGFLLRAEGSVYPPVWSVGETFGEVHGEAAAYLTPAAGPRPTLALRVGGKRVWGQFPFHEAAHVGGPDLVRGLRRQRYAGESAVFANAEVRIPVARINLLVPADVGVFGLVDTGRVFVEGESSDRWHTGAGAGLSIAFLKPENTVSFTVARSEGKTRLYAALGFVF